MNYMTGIRFVLGDDVKAFSTESMKMMTDTGATCNYVPKKYFKAFVNILKSYFPK